MSFHRAFSSRRRNQSHDVDINGPVLMSQRAASQRGGKPIMRNQISGPKALISTSNAQLNNAHNIIGAQPIEIRHVSSGSNVSSSDESEMSNSSMDSQDTVTDASSIDEPEPNHLTQYFKPSVDTRWSQTSARTSAHTSMDSPMIPTRVPSHSKRAHENIHRKRSIQRMLSPPASLEVGRETARNSPDMFSSQRCGFVEAPKDSNPFGKELAQLDEVAEEFGQVLRGAEHDADEVYMESHGLAHFSASDYMSEIQSLIHEMFHEEKAEHNFGGFF